MDANRHLETTHRRRRMPRCFETPSGCALGKACQQIFKVNPSDVALRYRRSEPGERPNVMGTHSINRGSVCWYLAQPPSVSVNQSVDVVSPEHKKTSNELPAAPRATHGEPGFHRADSRHESRAIKPLSPFASIAKRLGQYYGGNCTLTFGNGPFLEILHFEQRPIVHGLNAIVIASLKTPTLDFVSAILRSEVYTQEAKSKYQELVKYEVPAVTADEQRLLYDADDGRSDEMLRERTIETTGVQFVYFPEVYLEEDEERHRSDPNMDL
jgi:hypothetical protein